MCLTLPDYIRYGVQISADLVRCRLLEVQAKLAIEARVRTGTENLLSALSSGDPRQRIEVERKLADTKAKQSLLLRSKNRYAQLYIPGSMTSGEATTGSANDISGIADDDGMSNYFSFCVKIACGLLSSVAVKYL